MEDQKAGVFPLTLRNMWALVSVINPVLSTLTIIIMPLDHLLVSSVAVSKQQTPAPAPAVSLLSVRCRRCRSAALAEGRGLARWR